MLYIVTFRPAVVESPLRDRHPLDPLALSVILPTLQLRPALHLRRRRIELNDQKIRRTLSRTCAVVIVTNALLILNVFKKAARHWR